MPFPRSVESLLAANQGRATFVLRASLVAIAPSLLVFGVLGALGIDKTLRVPLGALDKAFAAYSVLLAPAIESAAMLALTALVARLVPNRAALQIVLVALVAALAHRIGGNWRQVALTAWPILVYSTCLVLWWPRSAGDAFIVTTIVHAVYNAAIFVAGIVEALALPEG